MSRLVLVPVTLREANRFIGEEHRHHGTTRGCRFCLGAMQGDTLVGVIVVGRTVARGAHARTHAEVTRLATDGTKNACSFLYAAARRVCQTMGYTSLITYTLARESGSSLRALGLSPEARVKGRSWDCESRPRIDTHPTEDKHRWQLMLELS